MVLQIRRWVAPPVFPDDEIKTRRASLLNAALINITTLVPVLFVGNWLGGKTPPSVLEANVLAVALCLVLRAWLHRGRVRRASLGLMTLGLVLITVSAASLGTIRTPTTAMYLLMVITAGWLFDLRGMMITTALCALLIGGLIGAENAGLLPRPDYTVTITQWIAYTAICAWAGSLTLSALQAIRQALARADQDIAERQRVEAALLESERRYRDLFDHASIAIFQSSLEDKVITVNPEFAHLFGFESPDEVCAKVKHVSTDLFVDPRRRAEILRLKDQNPGLETFENLYRRKDGSTFLGKLKVRAITNAGGQILYLEGFIEDITAHQRAEAVLRDSELKYRTLFEESFDGLFITSPDGKILDMNKKGIALFGYDTRAEIMRLDLARDVYAYPPDRNRILAMVNAHGTAEYEVTVKKKSGDTLLTQCSLTAVKDEQGAIAAYRGIIRDITEKKRAEQKANQLAAIVQFSEDAIIGKTLDGLVTSWNRGAEKIYGFSESEMIGQPISKLIPPGHEDEVPRLLDKIKSGEYIEHYETVRRRQDGRLIDVSLAVSPICDSDSRVVAASTIGRDITEHKRLEEVLRSNARYTRSLIEASLDPLVTISPEGQITDVNHATELATGVAPDRLIGSDFSSYFTEPDKARAGYQQVLAQGLVRDYPLTIRDTANRTTDVLYNAAVYRNEMGEIQGVFAAARDITERKRAEQALQDSQRSLEEERYLLHALVDNIPDAIYFKNIESCFLRINQAHARHFGLSDPAQVVGKTDFDFFTEEHARPAYEDEQAILRSGQPLIDKEEKETWPDGRVGWVSTTKMPLYDQAGRIVGTFGISRDMTERKQMEVAEREQRTLSEALQAAIAAMTSTLDFDEVLDRILIQASRVVPCDAAAIYQLDGQTVQAVRWHTATDRPVPDLARLRFDALATRNFADMLTMGQPLVIPDTSASPGWLSVPEVRWIRSYAGTLIQAHGQILGILEMDSATSNFYDATAAARLAAFADQAAVAIENARLYAKAQRYTEELEQRVAERTSELTQANARLQELDRLKSKFVADVSHELRTPVTSLGLYIDLFEYGKPEKQAHYLVQLKEQMARLRKLINEILDLSRLEREQNEADWMPVDLNSIVEHVVSTQQVTAGATGLQLMCAVTNGPLLVTARPDHLSQAVTNLLTNAIKYTHAGVVQVKTALVGARTCVQVSDTGIGIASEDLPHVFDRFYRGQQVAQSTIPGTGLGLAIVKEIVEAHGGTVEGESELGVGSTFRVWLPAVMG